jgi:hypothetical protein
VKILLRKPRHRQEGMDQIHQRQDRVTWQTLGKVIYLWVPYNVNLTKKMLLLMKAMLHGVCSSTKISNITQTHVAFCVFVHD